MDKRWIYIIKSGDHFKIGVSFRIRERMLSLQTSSPHRISLVAAAKVEGARTYEALLHDRLSSKRMTGEWFALSDEDVSSLKSEFAMKGTYIESIEEVARFETSAKRVPNKPTKQRTINLRVSEEEYVFLSSLGNMSSIIRAGYSSQFSAWRDSIERNESNEHPGWRVEKVNPDGSIAISHTYKTTRRDETLPYSHPDYLFFRGVPVGDEVI